MIGRPANGNFYACEKSYSQELLVIPGYKGLMSSDILDGNENSMFRRSLELFEQKFSTHTCNLLGTTGDWAVGG